MCYNTIQLSALYGNAKISIVLLLFGSQLKTWKFRKMVLITSLHKQCDVITRGLVLNVHNWRCFTSRSSPMWININKKICVCLYFSHSVYIVVIITCRILRFQYGGSFWATECRIWILRRIFANQIDPYKQIQREFLISWNGESVIN